MPDLPGPCKFEGHATLVHLKGQGLAVLTEGAAFSRGSASRVDFPDAELRPVGRPDLAPVRPEAVEQQASLEPVNMNAEGAAYDVTYRAGPPLTVRIDAGGTSGRFHGRAAGVDCTGKDGCDVLWGAGPKVITLHRVAGAGPIAVTGAFPFGDRDPVAPERSAVTLVELEGVTGTLTCSSGRAEPLAGKVLSWLQGASSVSDVWIDAEGLALTVKSAAAPARPLEPPSPQPVVPLAAAALAGVLLLAGIVAFLYLRHRKHKPRKEDAEPARATAAPVDVFLSYASEDSALLVELKKHLRQLERSGALRTWSARKIGAGEEYRRRIRAELDNARVILLLVSADFLASDDLYDVEVARAMERHEAGEARVIPIILRACDWHRASFGKLDPLPTGGKPVSDPTAWPTRDDAFKSIADGVAAALRALPPARTAPFAPA